MNELKELKKELEEKEQLMEEVNIHLNALKVSETWHKRQKQELLDRIKELEAEVEGLKKQTPQALVDEIESYKKEIESLKSQLEKQNAQLTAQIEVKETKKWPWKKK